MDVGRDSVIWWAHPSSVRIMCRFKTVDYRAELRRHDVRFVYCDGMPSSALDRFASFLMGLPMRPLTVCKATNTEHFFERQGFQQRTFAAVHNRHALHTATRILLPANLTPRIISKFSQIAHCNRAEWEDEWRMKAPLSIKFGCVGFRIELFGVFPEESQECTSLEIADPRVYMCFVDRYIILEIPYRRARCGDKFFVNEKKKGNFVFWTKDIYNLSRCK